MIRFLYNELPRNKLARNWTIKIAAQELFERRRDGHSFSPFYSKTRQNFKIARESNLVLANREARLAAPSGTDFKPKNQWAALCAAHEMALQKPSCFVLEPEARFELATSALRKHCSTTELLRLSQDGQYRCSALELHRPFPLDDSIR